MEDIHDVMNALFVELERFEENRVYRLIAFLFHRYLYNDGLDFK